MTDTIVSFAEPLLAEVPPKTAEEMERLFDRVIDIWNMWVASQPPWNDDRGMDELKAAIEAGELSPAEMYVHRVLAERWLALFHDDGRIVVNRAVTREGDEIVFRCVGCTATPELLETFRGTPS